ncbi:hypothetical protein N9Q68_02100, partial [Polaribacter sp.]|nr:hypothetical protein [Polaribacter sp.]
GQLYKTITKDENHTSSGSAGTSKNHTTEEFKNKQGQVVLKRTYAATDTATSEAHDTYYVYDRYGNLTYVLPPKVNTIDGISDSELAELCYQYTYDKRNRLIAKKIPGKGWESIVYDQLDRPVLTQDALLQTQNYWLVTKYDILGRVVYTGMYTHDSLASQAAMQSHFDAHTTSAADYYETKQTTAGALGMYYSNGNFPTTNIAVFTANYYDNYTFDRAGTGTAVSAYGVNTTTRLKGLPTGSKVKVLGTAHWSTTVSYYDEKARPIYVYAKNEYLKTTDIIKSSLDFVGKVVETTTLHTKTDDNLPTITTIDAFEYDAAGRLKQHTQQIGSQAIEILLNNTYDALGQLQSKGVGGKTTQDRLQTVDYSYNVRGWLKQVNTPSNLGNDLFGFKINYNTTDISESTQLYNGNISEALWNSKSENPSGNALGSNYSYAYDALNRITKAVDNTGNYNLEQVAYDKNGNILALQRKGHTNTNATSFGIMDDLSYTYNQGNKLQSVIDSSLNEQGFKDGNLTGDDYTYDANGNMTSDANKKITSIAYNHLNLPKKILSKINSSVINTIEYVYDATGVKLSKKVYDMSSNWTPTTTTSLYAGNYIYKNNTLQFFNHAEGYVQNNNGIFTYVYQYKDHLGNVRLSYNETAPSETIIETDFDDGDTSAWIIDPSVQTSTDDGRLRVYQTIPYKGIQAIESIIQDKNYTISFDLDLEELEGKFQFVVYSPNSGLIINEQIAESGSHSFNFDGLHSESHQIIFRAWELNSSSPYYLNNIKVVQNADLDIIEESNYYPFGLKHKGYNNVVSSNGNSTAQKFGFEGVELEESLGYNMNEMDFRHYDPALGRFNVIDPMAEKRNWLNPYNFVQNNPILRIDPTGLLDTYGLGEDGDIRKIDDTKYYDDAGNEIDKLVADKNGKSIDVADGVLDTTKDKTFVSKENGTKDAEFDTYQSTDLTNAENSTEIFEFVAENSSVEFG